MSNLKVDCIDLNTLDLVCLTEDYDVRSEDDIFAEYYDIEVCPMPRKGKYIINHRRHKFAKKTKIRLNCYNDKLYTIDSNLPSIFTVWDNKHCDSRGDDCYCYDENSHSLWHRG